ncbi:phage tail protein [Streptomyces sp. NPDC001984]
MALNIGELVGLIRADDRGMRRGLSDAQMRMAGFQRDVNGRLRDLHGHFITESDALGRAIAAGLGDGSDEGVRLLRTRLRAGLRAAGDDTDRGLSGIWRRFVTRSGQAGDDSGRGFAGRVVSSLGSVLSRGLPAAFNAAMSAARLPSIATSNPWVAGVGLALAAAVVATAAPLIGALLSGAVIAVSGLAIIGLGAALLKNEPEVKSASKKLMDTVKKEFAGAAQPLKKPLVDAINSVAKTAKDVAPQIRQAFDTVAKSGALKSLTDGFDQLVKNALPGFNQALTQTGPVFEGLKSLLGDIGKGLGDFFESVSKGGPGAGLALQDLGKIIRGTFIVIGETIGLLAQAYAGVRKFITNVIGFFQHLYDVLVGHSIVPDMVNAIIRWFAGLPGRAWSALSSLGSKIAGRASSALSSMGSAVRTGLDTAVKTIKGLPGRAGKALGDLSSTLWSSGSSLIGGFIDGIWARIGDVADAASSVVSAARDYFPFSPAKKGPFSGRGYTTYSGRALIAGLERGIAAGLPSLKATLGSLPGLDTPALAMPGAGHITGYGARMSGTSTVQPQQKIKLEVNAGPGTANRLIASLIRDYVNVNGGNVQVALMGRRS